MKCTIPTFEDGTRDWKCDGETTNKNGICDSCTEFGWINDPTEIANAIAADPLFRDQVDIVSPIQPEDLST